MADGEAQFLSLFPADLLPKLAAIQEDKKIDEIARHNKLMELLLTLGPEVHAKIEALPPPPFFEHLPDDVKGKMMTIKDDTTLSFPEKAKKYQALLNNLPADVKKKLNAPRQ